MMHHAFARGSRRLPLVRRRSKLALEVLEPRLNLSLSVPEFSSLPGANHTIYLDFDGQVTTGTSWNSSYGVDPIVSPAYSTDSDRLNFSTSELTNIERIWKRVSEDFAPFQVNVTTVAPPVEDLMKNGTGDTKWGVRVIVTQDVAFACGCGGIAYINSFSWNTDTPVWVFNTSEVGVAEAASHEVGHSLGLSHDGTASSSYYQGHGTGTTSWAPIMGVGYYVNVSQWDKGEYYGSNNASSTANYGKGPDDLNIITTYHGFSYKVDDYGNSLATAAALPDTSGAVSASGIVSTTSDVDVFQFSTAGGTVSLSIAPAALGANLDVLAELLDANGQVLATSNATSTLGASFSLSLPAGQYFLRIDGTGVGNPAANPPTGYSDYASLGQYTISGSIVPATGDSLSISPTQISQNEGNSGPSTYSFTVTRSGDTTGTTTVDYVVSGSSSSAAAASDFVGSALPSGSLTFLPGVTSQTISIDVAGDTLIESNEEFTLSLVNPSTGTSISQGFATGTIVNDDVAPLPPTFNISATDAQKAEGTGTASTPFVFTIGRLGDVSQSGSVKYSVVGSGAKKATSSDFTGGFPTGVLVSFAAGQTSIDITVPVLADSTKESNETFTVSLSSPVGGTLGTSSATGSILNDDSGKTGRTSSDDAIPQLIAVADPLWSFEPISQLTPAQLAIPMITWVDGVPLWGELEDGELDALPALEAVASLLSPDALWQEAGGGGSEFTVMALDELPSLSGGLAAAVGFSAWPTTIKLEIIDELDSLFATMRRREAETSADELACDAVFETWDT